MPFTGHRMRDAFEAQSELGFTVWSYATNDTLEEVLRPNYFLGVHHRLRLGDLIFLGISPQPPASPWQERAGETRRALLMITSLERGVRCRLVQDYGRPEDPPAESLAVRRPRGRPRKVSA
jgi:hypothetical protein